MFCLQSHCSFEINSLEDSRSALHGTPRDMHTFQMGAAACSLEQGGCRGIRRSKLSFNPKWIQHTHSFRLDARGPRSIDPDRSQHSIHLMSAYVTAASSTVRCPTGFSCRPAFRSPFHLPSLLRPISHHVSYNRLAHECRLFSFCFVLVLGSLGVYRRTQPRNLIHTIDTLLSTGSCRRPTHVQDAETTLQSFEDRSNGEQETVCVSIGSLDS